MVLKSVDRFIPEAGHLGRSGAGPRLRVHSPLRAADRATIQRTLEEAGLPSRRLELEITESGLLEAGPRNVEIIHAIRAFGVRVVIDGFGTGYSMMSHLQNFVFDKLRIDRRFIQNLGNNANSAAIIRSIARLRADIGIETSAEGVETEEQFSAVFGSGCSEVQGYLFSKPLTADMARRFIAGVAEGDGPVGPS